MKRLGLISAVLGAVMLLPAAAEARSGWTTAGVKLREGPGTHYKWYYVVPAYARIDVYDCDYGWCQIKWQGYDGYISSRYISYQRYYRPRRGYSGGGYSGGGAYRY